MRGVRVYRERDGIVALHVKFIVEIFCFLSLATKLWQCNVFTPVCHSVCPHGGVCHPPWADTPWADTHSPVQCMLGYGQQVGGTHPTGIHSCYRPRRSCGQGNIFTPVCHSFCSQGGCVCLSACWDTPRADTPPEQTPLSRHPPGTRHPLRLSMPPLGLSTPPSGTKYTPLWD